MRPEFTVEHKTKIQNVVEILDRHRRKEAQGDHEWKDKQEYIDKLLGLSLDGELKFVLPGFPLKSPNSELVLGTLPDEGERTALRNLNNLMEELSEAFGSQVRLTIFSDGAVFNDLFEISTETAQTYNGMIKTLNKSELIDVVSMQDYFPEKDFESRREQFLNQYGESIESIKAKLQSDESVQKRHAIFARYVTNELELKWRQEEPDITHEAIIERSSQRAVLILQRNVAYGNLIKELFPEHSRLSVHPDTGGEKLGINLISDMDRSETPWHNVLVINSNGSKELMPKSKAEQINATLVHDEEGNPSHYIL